MPKAGSWLHNKTFWFSSSRLGHWTLQFKQTKWFWHSCYIGPILNYSTKGIKIRKNGIQLFQSQASKSSNSLNKKYKFFKKITQGPYMLLQMALLHSFLWLRNILLPYLGKEYKKEWIHVYVELIHFAIHLKLTHGKSLIL